MLALDPSAQIASSTEVNDGVITIPIPGNNPGLDGDLWTLLEAIAAAGVPLKGKIAEYAGFYNKVTATGTQPEWDPGSENGTAPDLSQTGASQPNKSMEKLTFMIMFRLPFTAETVEVSPGLVDPEADLVNNRKIFKKADLTYAIGAFHGEDSPSFKLCSVTRPNPVAGFDLDGQDLWYDAATKAYYVPGAHAANFGDPLDPNGATWSRKANLIRQAQGLMPLNGAGEQVDSVGPGAKLVDDAGNEISFAFGQQSASNAYDYYEIDFNDLYPGEVPRSEITSPDMIDVIRKTPLYYFLTVFTENPPALFHREPHFPENTLTPVLASRPITFSAAPAGGVGKVEQDGTGYYVTVSGTKLYFTEDLAGFEDFTVDSFYKPGATLVGMSIVSKDGKYYAQNSDIITQMSTPLNSGLTLGYGYDIGAANYRLGNYYKVEFTIQKLNTASGTFTLWYGGKQSSAIAYSVNVDQMKTILCEFMGLHPEIVTVETATAGLTAGYGGWFVSIQQRIDSRKVKKGVIWNIYSHELFYKKPATESPAKILITPQTDSVRYKGRAGEYESGVEHFTNLENILNGFYESGNYLIPDPVNDGSHVQGFDANDFREVLKKMIGLSRGPAKVIYLKSLALINKFQMPPVDKSYLKNYDHIFCARYFKDKMRKNNLGDAIQPGALPNVLENLLLATVSYGGLERWFVREFVVNETTLTPKLDSNGHRVKNKRVDPAVVLAISSHDNETLKSLFEKKNPSLGNRRRFLTAHVDKFGKMLYRGVGS